MRSCTTARFRAAFTALPASIQERARRAYRLFRENPDHPSLRFKRIHSRDPIYSVRITRSYRALGVIEAGTVVWFWIGSHADYDTLLSEP